MISATALKVDPKAGLDRDPPHCNQPSSIGYFRHEKKPRALLRRFCIKLTIKLMIKPE